ncbi:MAG TPA: aldehyde dehydrogenase family protein [Gemmatimonadales bacterium]|nr:aldehyde dehydrogenase family protein [Gemmatimonadales bacterium]
MPATDASPTYPSILAGERRAEGPRHAVHNPWDGSLVGHAAYADAAAVRAAIDAAVAAAPAARAMPAHARARLLERVGCGVADRKEELAQLLAREAGKPIANARLELERTLFVFEYAAEEAKRLGGEVYPTDLLPQGERRLAVARRFPLAPIAGILPFNFPLLLAAHKLGPALAVGATMVLKAPPQDPLSTLLLGEIVAGALGECGWPAGTLSVLATSVEDAAPLLDDPRVRMVSFTGSARAGWAIRARAATKRVVLELGGNAGVVVAPDADLDHAARRCAAGGYAYAGQSCISTQRILVHEAVHDAFVERFVAAVAALRTGDPLDAATDVGPMIDEAAAARAEGWIRDAVSAGARVATGGGRRGAVLEPTVLLDAAPRMQVVCEEVFAPVVAVRRYADFDAALAELDDSPYGLQAGLFTHDLRRILAAHERVEVGALVVNDVPGWRVDSLPYGGVKASGMGREGVRSAMEEMTELRLLVLG